MGRSGVAGGGDRVFAVRRRAGHQRRVHPGLRAGMSLTCPQCGQRMTLDFKTDQVHCPHCGYIRPDEISGLEAKEQTVRAHGAAPPVELTYKGTINPGALAAFNSGQDALFEGDKAGALQHFRRAVDTMPEWTDAHLWIAKVTDDEQTKR